MPRAKGLLLLLALLLAACAGRAADQRPLTSYNRPAEVTVTFNVLVPADTPDETIELSVLDPVTGLAFNPQRQTMKLTAENTYSATVTAPIGAIIHYRYERRGETSVPEAAANGAVIEQRRFLVTGSGVVANDLVSAWSDQSAASATGRISGMITDAESGAPVRGLLVTASGIETQTDSSGVYILEGLYQGQHNLVVSSPDGSYKAFQQAALVAEGMDTPASIQVEANAMINVLLNLEPPDDSVPGIPLYLVGNLRQLGAEAQSPDDYPRMQAQPDGSYSLSLLLPTGTDIRYKYSLGDGLWNAEHLANDAFALRQLIIPTTETSFGVQDTISSWQAGDSAPIWFELDVPADPPAGQVYLQFKLLDWMAPIPMWGLGENHWAYKLYSPTNFGSPLEYRYCADSACATPEISDSPRTVTGNQSSLQLFQDVVSGWQGQ